MPVPSPRNKILPARGDYADLASNVASILDGEICYAIDQDQYYQNEGGTLVAVGATKAQGLLADSAVQPGDNVSELVNDAGYITLAGVPDDLVTSVAGKTGDVVLVKADITDFADADYATAAQGALADSATQPGDNISTLTNDAGYITSAQVPTDSVTSVNSQTGVVVLNTDDISDASATNKYTTAAEKTKLAGIADGAEVNAVASVAGKTGAVTLDKSDVGLGNVDNTADADKPISTATQTALNGKADLVEGVLDVAQLPEIAISEYKGNVADQAAMLAVTGEKGDWVIRNDDSKVYVITGSDPSVIGGWTALSYPAGFSGAYADLTGKPTLGTAAATDSTDYATAAQGALADSATQPGDLATVATTGAYSDLSGTPTIPTLGNYDNTGLYTFDASGNFTATGNVTAFSDARLKENIETIPHALEKVSAVRGVTYDRNDVQGPRQAGVIAQEVEAVLPEAVITHENGIKSVAYGNLVGLLIEAVKELKAEVETLKQERN